MRCNWPRVLLPALLPAAAAVAACLPAAGAAAAPADRWLTGPQGAERCFAAAAEPCPLGPGVSYRRLVRTSPRAMVIHVTEIDLAAAGVRVTTTPGDRSGGMEYRAATTSAMLARSGALLGINASYFLPFVGGSRGGNDFVPQPGSPADASGAVVAGGISVSKADSVDARVDSIACFGAGRAVITAGQSCPDGLAEGVSAGPRLLIDGAAQPQPDVGDDGVFRGAVQPPPRASPATPSVPQNLAPRTALGLDAAGRRLWLVVVDGRQPGYSEGAAHDDMAALFRELGAANAMSLDGGGSATMAARGVGGPVVLNRPIHTGVPGRERPVANHLLVFSDTAALAAPRGSGLLPPLEPRPVARLAASLERIHQAPEARQGVAVDALHFYALVNTAIGKYRRDTGQLVKRWAAPRGGLIRHLNSCTVVGSDLVCAHSNHPEVPMASSVEVFDTATLAHKSSRSLGLMDEGSLTIAEPMAGGWLLGFTHYSDETGSPFKSSDYSSLIAADSEFRKVGAWTIPAPIRALMAPQAASGGAIGADGLLYLFGHTLPELYVLAKPAMGPELIHVATVTLDAAGQAFAFDPAGARRIFTIDRPTGTVRVFSLPPAPPLPTDARLFSRP